MILGFKADRGENIRIVSVVLNAHFEWKIIIPIGRSCIFRNGKMREASMRNEIMHISRT